MWFTGQAFFDTITVDVGPLQAAVMKSAVDEGINLRAVGKTRVGITLDERTRPENDRGSVARLWDHPSEDEDYTPITTCLKS